MTTETQIERLEQNFKKLMQHILDESVKAADLDKAMGDAASATKEQIKISALQENLVLFDQAKSTNSMEELKMSFLSLLDTQKQIFQAAIKEAKEKGDKEELIRQQIKLSVINGPVEGSFKAYYNKAKES